MHGVVLGYVTVDSLGVGDVNMLVNESHRPVLLIKHGGTTGEEPTLHNLEVLRKFSLQKMIPPDRILLVGKFQQVAVKVGERCEPATTAILEV